VKFRLIVALAIVCGVLFAASAERPALATNINVSAPSCQASLPESVDLVVHENNGVHSFAPIGDIQWITCSIPRSPLAPGATFGSFYVDGDNVNGAFTTCWVSSYTYLGDLLGSTSFQTFSAHYDILLTLPAAQLGPWDYTSLTCALPPHGNGLLRGVTTLQ
jgi:hypothetical protein